MSVGQLFVVNHLIQINTLAAKSLNTQSKLARSLHTGNHPACRLETV